MRSSSASGSTWAKASRNHSMRLIGREGLAFEVVPVHHLLEPRVQKHEDGHPFDAAEEEPSIFLESQVQAARKEQDREHEIVVIRDERKRQGHVPEGYAKSGEPGRPNEPARGDREDRRSASYRSPEHVVDVAWVGRAQLAPSDEVVMQEIRAHPEEEAQLEGSDLGLGVSSALDADPRKSHSGQLSEEGGPPGPARACARSLELMVEAVATTRICVDAPEARRLPWLIQDSS